MKTYLLLGLLAILFLPQAVFAEEAELSEHKQMEIRNLQLNIEEREMELDFNRQMRELEIKKQHIGMQERFEKKKQYAGGKRPYDKGGFKRHRDKAGYKRYHDKAGFKRHHDKGGGIIFAIIVIVHILLAVWVFQDIRKKSESSGIWIVIALLTGLLGVLVYAVVRLGDIRKTSSA
jgi:hypothetical protein